MQKPSEKQLAANRKNARKCTGPKTAIGKQISALNSIKHGFHAKDLVLQRKDSPEDPREFETLLDELMRDYDPQSVIERELVGTVASCLWRMRRAQRFETSLMGRKLNHAALDAIFHKKHMDYFFEFQKVHVDKLNRAMGYLTRLENPPSESDQAAMEEYQRLVAEVQEELQLKSSGDALIEQMKKRLQSVAFDTMTITLANGEMYESRKRYQNSIEPAPDVLLPDFNELRKQSRYENTVGRQLHRALSELRKIREERRGKKEESTAEGEE